MMLALFVYSRHGLLVVMMLVALLVYNSLGSLSLTMIVVPMMIVMCCLTSRLLQSSAQDLEAWNLYVEKDSQGVISLFTRGARREGETICHLPALLFETITKLETFLSTGGHKVLCDRVMKISGVRVHEEEEAQDIYAALMGAGRYVRHYLGLRKGGANAVFSIDPAQGASDAFLSLKVQTRNLVGIAARSMIVANFGLMWDSSSCVVSAGSESEAPAKRFRGMLDKYFQTAGEAQKEKENEEQTKKKEEEGQKKAKEAEEQKKKEEEEAKKKEEQKKKEADGKAAEEAEKSKAGGSGSGGASHGGLSPGQKLPDGGIVVALVEEAAVKGALVFKEGEAGGSLTLKAGDEQEGNKKLPPKTFLWRVPDIEVKATSECPFEWNFEKNIKAAVYHNKTIIPLQDLIQQKGATMVSRHVPESFPAGVPPTTLKVQGTPFRLTTKDELAQKILKAWQTDSTAGMAWSVALKDGDKKVTATGAVLYTKKQVIVPKGGEVRLW